MSRSLDRHVSLFHLPFTFHLFHISKIKKKKPGEDRIKRTLRTEELAGDVEGFTSHDDDLLAIEQLLGNSASQATKEVSLAVNDDLLNIAKKAKSALHPETHRNQQFIDDIKQKNNGCVFRLR